MGGTGIFRHRKNKSKTAIGDAFGDSCFKSITERTATGTREKRFWTRPTLAVIRSIGTTHAPQEGAESAEPPKENQR